MRDQLKELFISYVNEFVSLEVFAEAYNVSMSQARRIIKLGRILWDRDIKPIKG